MLTKRLVETFDAERQLAEIWIVLKELGGTTVTNTRTFEELTERQQRAEIWDAIRGIGNGGPIGGVDGITSIASGASSKTVTFPIPFQETPRLIADVQKPTSGSDNVRVHGLIVNENGFTVFLNQATPTNGYYVHWNAKEMIPQGSQPPTITPTFDSEEITFDSEEFTFDSV